MVAQRKIFVALMVAVMAFGQPYCAVADTFDLCPEQRNIEVRDTSEFTRFPMPPLEIPYTIANEENRTEEKLSLDQAIQIAIQNADVVRILTGVTASSSGSTIYDVAINNASIDEQLAVFDPTFNVQSTMNKVDSAFASFDPFNPGQSIIGGSSTDSINTSINLSKNNRDGSQVGLNFNTIGSFFEPGVAPLEPEFRTFVELTLNKPWLRGAGHDVNLTPVIVSRINVEQSYFQFKSSVQNLVSSVIAAYWNLVSARIDNWARKQQVEQADFAFKRAKARKDQGLATAADVAQARSALANFRSASITARSNILLTETALRNVLGLPPSNSTVIVPTSVPELKKVDFNWDQIVELAEQYRPDIIELKLVLEADTHLLVQADNFAKPNLNTIANYRWDGISGEMPNGNFLASEGGRFAGFNLGVNFSVPLGLRQDRASLRQQELVVIRDRKNLEQGIHAMSHQLVVNYRNLEQFFQQYEASKEAREAARISYENQAGEVLAGRRELINVLQAITDWGNAISNEASAVTLYNTELANIELETGTILETHGIRFFEERHGAIAPTLFGIKRPQRNYPKQLSITGTDDRYLESANRSDDAFKLERLSYESPEDAADATEEDIRAMERDNRDASGQQQPEMRIKSLEELMEQQSDSETESLQLNTEESPLLNFKNIAPSRERTSRRRSLFKSLFR